MALLENKFSTGYIWTTTTVTATGATTLVNAPVTNSSIVVYNLRVISMTATTGQVEGSFGDTTTVGHFGLTPATGVGQMLSEEFPNGWMLNTGSALIFAATVSAASSPSLRVTALVRILRRGDA